MQPTEALNKILARCRHGVIPSDPEDQAQHIEMLRLCGHIGALLTALTAPKPDTDIPLVTVDLLDTLDDLQSKISEAIGLRVSSPYIRGARQSISLAVLHAEEWAVELAHVYRKVEYSSQIPPMQRYMADGVMHHVMLACLQAKAVLSGRT